MTWIYVPPDSLTTGTVDLDGAATHYLGRVLRARPGQTVTLFDGEGRIGRAVLDRLSASSARAVVESLEQVPAEAGHLTAEVALIKGERMDLCVQKLTELRVDAIVPIVAARSVVKLGGRRLAKRMDRYRDIVVAAAAQAENPRPPIVSEPRTLEELDRPQGPALAMLAREEAHPLTSEELPDDAGVRFCIGPEGGWDEDERAALRDLGYRSCSLGPGVLRAETAAIAAAAMVRMLMGRCD